MCVDVYVRKEVFFFLPHPSSSSSPLRGLCIKVLKIFWLFLKNLLTWLTSDNIVGSAANQSDYEEHDALHPPPTPEGKFF